jgi:hypothetical protein
VYVARIGRRGIGTGVWREMQKERYLWAIIMIAEYRPPDALCLLLLSILSLLLLLLLLLFISFLLLFLFCLDLHVLN